jgi:uncharacterized protein (TIGR02588 family)
MNKNTLEWTVFSVSVVLILGVVVVLLQQQFTAGNAPPSIVTAEGEAIETAGGFVLPIDVRNDGDVTAEEVRVEATLTWPGGTEVGETTLAFVPYRSHRRAWIAFSRNPGAGRLTVRVLGYREP